MAKTFAGARLRRLREEHRLTQVELARVLELSPSYLNQLEHDARPLTVTVLLRLTESFGVEASYFAPRDTARLTAELRDALVDDLDEGRVSASEVAETAERLPGIARALIDLRSRHDRIATAVTADRGETPGGAARPPTAHEQVRDFFYRRRNHVPELDEAAERTAGEIGVRAGETRAALVRRLAERHGVKVTISETLGQGGPGDTEELHRFEADQNVLRLAPHLRPGQRAFRVATQIAMLEFGDLMDDALAAAGTELPDGDSRALTRIGLAHYGAAALMLPYGAFLTAAERTRYDLERLADHFGVGFETVCHRLSTLQRSGRPGVPFSFVRVDRAGNMSKRQSATGFHFSRSGGTCPLWNVYEAFASPGRVLTQIAEMPDGQRYLWIARTVSRRRGGWHAASKTFSVGLGCEMRHAERLVYSDGLDLADRSTTTPIGAGCRTCERLGCPQRAFPPLGRALDVDEDRSTFVPYPVRTPHAPEADGDPR